MTGSRWKIGAILMLAPLMALSARAQSAPPPMPMPGEPLTLDRALALAKGSAPAIRTARARVALTDAARVEAAFPVPENPEIAVGVGARTTDGAAGFEFDVAISQKLEIAGEAGRRVASAAARRRVAEAAVDEVRWAVAAEVERLFARIALVDEELTFAKSFEGFSEALRKAAQGRVDAGANSKLSVLIADTELARTREAVLEVAQRGRALRLRLARVIGLPTTAVGSVRGELPPVRASPSTEPLWEVLLRRHPELQTAELEVEAGRRRIALEDREAWPKPTLEVSYGREPGGGLEPAAHKWMLKIAVPLPLVRRNQEGQSAARAKVLVAELEREEALVALRAQLERAVQQTDSARRRLALFESGVMPPLEEALSRLRTAFERGAIDIHDVSQAQARVFEAGRGRLRAKRAYFDGLLEIRRLVGPVGGR